MLCAMASKVQIIQKKRGASTIIRVEGPRNAQVHRSR